MIEHKKILYTMIAEWELAERLRREDDQFNAWEFLAAKCELKNASTLRNMCIGESENNKAKLGFEQSIIIQEELNDYRLFHYMRERLKETKLAQHQLDLFATPLRSLEYQL